MKHFLMIAAENGALPGGKVGGIGDVLRDVPIALAARGCKVTVLTPAYGNFSSLPRVEKLQKLSTRFRGIEQAFEVFVLPETTPGVRHLVIEHPLFSQFGKGKIYHNDLPGRPFAVDAGKFALFCAAAAQCVSQNLFGNLDAIHLHDWHAAVFLLLRRFDPKYRALQNIRCAYSIHNLAIQGIRPFAGDESSLQQWFPEISYPRKLLADPRWVDCFNPMATAIRLADAVHAVSPHYAEEILEPSDVDGRGYYGGEGLELDLRQARDEGRLFGILNGCEYPPKKKPQIGSWKALLERIRQQQLDWIGASPNVSSAHYLAQIRLGLLNSKRPRMLVTSVGRITGQKIGIMQAQTSSGQPALEQVLDKLGDAGLMLMVGSGDAEVEQFLVHSMARCSNFIYLRGYSEYLADALYDLGDLFFMPSSYEPCGISQMLALRAGQPCLVHHVGGLRDTVTEGETGFAFGGDTPQEKAGNLVGASERAFKLFHDHPQQWKALRKAAAAARFEWTDSVDLYLKQLYQ